MAYAWHPTSDAREPVKYATTYNKVFITQLYDRYHISYIKLHGNPSDVQKHDNIVEHVRTIMNLKNQANHARNATEKTVFERSINAVNDELNTLIDALYQVEAQENGDEE